MFYEKENVILPVHNIFALLSAHMKTYPFQYPEVK